MRLKKYIVVKGIIKCETGLRIGASREEAGPGELDNPIIRHPISRLPYIPGSSLKGKLRSLLELKYSKRAQETGNPCDCGDYENCDVCRLFGCGDQKKTAQPTRLIFRDASLTEESEENLKQASEESGIHYSEVKSEIKMDRKSGTVQRSGPRQVERVPAGTEFDFEISMRVYEGDDEEHHKKKIQEALEMLEQDYLGGSGSRGYGKVTIRDLKFEDCVPGESR